MRKNKLTTPVNLSLMVDGAPLSIDYHQPTGHCAAPELIPVYQEITDQLVADAISRSDNPVSCKTGCTSCCSHPVPVSALEAQFLRKFISALPAARRKHYKERFRQVLVRLEEAGLLEQCQRIHQLEPDNRRELGLNYVALSIGCPFLENGSCSIYPQRPLECREYMVTSDPEHCASLNKHEIRKVKNPMTTVPTLISMSADSQEKASGYQPVSWILLPFLFEWDSDHRPRFSRSDPDQSLRTFWKGVLGKDL